MNASDEVLATPLQFLKGVGPRRAADFEHAGLITLEDLLYRFPIRYEDRSRLQPIASLKAGRSGSRRRSRAELRPALHAASRLQDLRRGHRRRHCVHPRVVVEPGVPPRRLLARTARRPVWADRDAGERRPAADEPAIRDPGRRRRRDDSYRPDRAGVREGRQRDAEDAAPARLRRAAAPSGGAAGSACRTPCARSSGCRRGRRR